MRHTRQPLICGCPFAILLNTLENRTPLAKLAVFRIRRRANRFALREVRLLPSRGGPGSGCGWHGVSDLAWRPQAVVHSLHSLQTFRVRGIPRFDLFFVLALSFFPLHSKKPVISHIFFGIHRPHFPECWYTRPPDPVLTPFWSGAIVTSLAGEPTSPRPGDRGQTAESSAVVCRRPVEPAPGNAGEGTQFTSLLSSIPRGDSKQNSRTL